MTQRWQDFHATDLSEDGIVSSQVIAKWMQEEINELRASRDALTSSLVAANSQTEEFERKWYLACDERDALAADAARYQALRLMSVKLSLPNDTIAMLLKDQSELDGAIKGAAK